MQTRTETSLFEDVISETVEDKLIRVFFIKLLQKLFGSYRASKYHIFSITFLKQGVSFGIPALKFIHGELLKNWLIKHPVVTFRAVITRIINQHVIIGFFSTQRGGVRKGLACAQAHLRVTRASDEKQSKPAERSLVKRCQESELTFSSYGYRGDCASIPAYAPTWTCLQTGKGWAFFLITRHVTCYYLSRINKQRSCTCTWQKVANRSAKPVFSRGLFTLVLFTLLKWSF